jgi:hypothetical protein
MACNHSSELGASVASVTLCRAPVVGAGDEEDGCSALEPDAGGCWAEPLEPAEPLADVWSPFPEEELLQAAVAASATATATAATDLIRCLLLVT